MLNLFLVDGSKSILTTLDKVISESENSCTVGKATTVSDALIQIRELKSELVPDVVLVDLDLPDGLLLIETLNNEFGSLGMAVIGTMIPDEDSDSMQAARSAGATLVLDKPIPARELRAAIIRAHKMASFRPYSASNSDATQTNTTEMGGQLLAFCSAKGGVGRTTLIVNLAIALAQEGHKVTVVDADFMFGNVAFFYNLKSEISIIDYVDGQQNWSAKDLFESLPTHASGVRILSAAPKPELAELVTVDNLSGVLDALRVESDFVLVDCPAWLTDTSLDVIEKASQVFLITDLTAPTMSNLSSAIQLLIKVGLDPNKLRLITIDSHSPSALTTQNVEAHFRLPSLANLPYEPSLTIDASYRGVPFYEKAGNRNPLNLEIGNLAAHLLGKEAAVLEPEPKKKGRFGRHKD